MTTLPAWNEFAIPVLRFLEDGATLTRRELLTGLADSMGLTEEQRAERLPSTEEPRAESRIGWAVSYLSRIQALARPKRAHYAITEKGHQILRDYPNGLTEADFRALSVPGDEWWLKKAIAVPSATRGAAEGASESELLDPREQIEQGIARMHADVAAELLSRLQEQDPTFFENAVVKLLVAMGYGGAEGKATVTQASGDGGIDGIIDRDALGLDRIYIQAKRYGAENPVGRPDIQRFVGALSGKASTGVFITTGRFSSGASEYAEQAHTRIILVDGTRLADLMIRYGVGVQAKQTLAVVEVDEDFFE